MDNSTETQENKTSEKEEGSADIIAASSTCCTTIDEHTNSTEMEIITDEISKTSEISNISLNCIQEKQEHNVGTAEITSESESLKPNQNVESAEENATAEIIDKSKENENITKLTETQSPTVVIKQEPITNQSNLVLNPFAASKQNSFSSDFSVSNYINSSGLSFLQSQYGTDDSDESEDECNVENNSNRNNQEYRSKITINSDDSDDSDVEILNVEQHKQKIIDLDELIDEDDEDQTNKYKGPIRVKGELLLEDLPPIEDLKISVPENECVELGKIQSIVDQLVLVDSIPGTVPLDLDTVLFLDKGKNVLGEIFDVLGQIKSPMYCVRFNSNKQIKEKGIEVGQKVFVAPRTEHTQFIILDNLMTLRGSDASWENDIEPNDKHRDFSDDEEEQRFRRNNKNRDKSNEHTSTSSSIDSTKRQRIATTTSSLSVESNNDADVEFIPPNSQFQNNRQFRYNGSNQRYSGIRQSRPSNQQQSFNNSNNYQRGAYSPRPRFQRGGSNYQNRFKNAPSFNYDNSSSGSWHSNYNSYGNPQHNYYQQQQQQQPQYRHQTLPPQQQHPILAQPNLYPNPYAAGAPYMAPNSMQQPLFPNPPPPPPHKEN